MEAIGHVDKEDVADVREVRVVEDTPVDDDVLPEEAAIELGIVDVGDGFGGVEDVFIVIFATISHGLCGITAGEHRSELGNKWKTVELEGRLAVGLVPRFFADGTFFVVGVGSAIADADITTAVVDDGMKCGKEAHVATDDL